VWKWLGYCLEIYGNLKDPLLLVALFLLHVAKLEDLAVADEIEYCPFHQDVVGIVLEETWTSGRSSDPIRTR
jgi:hypothetical protein